MAATLTTTAPRLVISADDDEDDQLVSLLCRATMLEA